MNQSPRNIMHIESIREAHLMFGLEEPRHPLVSVFRHSDLKLPDNFTEQSFTTDFYMIALKENQQAVLKYGRQLYDFHQGTLIFMAPNQVFSFASADFSECDEEWTIAFHPDFISRATIGKEIEHYHFFSYEINESLHLSSEEKGVINDFVDKIEREYRLNIDGHTQDLICINIESILKYCQRYYARQFITRSHVNKGYLTRFEKYLNDCFSDNLVNTGIPTVKQCGEALNMSSQYLSNLLKAETGKNAKEHIDLRLVNKAKITLQTSELSISEVAYELGFGYPNHFSKFFRLKTGVSPSEYRSLN